jgi:hypothetical protein
MSYTIKKPSYIIQSGGSEPVSLSGGVYFSGATIPITYKDNTHAYENNYVYKGSNHNITITGLDTRATIVNNGTKEVEVQFDVTSATSSLQEFTITLTNDDETLSYKGMHGHYGQVATGDSLVLAYTNVPRTGVGTLGTEYVFIEDTTLPYFSSETVLWNGIYSYQVLNGLFGNYSGTTISDSFLRYCYSFNQPLTIPSSVTSIGISFLRSCFAFNQPITIPSNLTSIGYYFLMYCYALSTITWNTTIYPTDDYSLGQTINSKTSTTGAGIKVFGTQRAGLLTALPDRTLSPYRKLVDGGAD